MLTKQHHQSPPLLALAALTLALVLAVVSGHEHEHGKQHSHFCQGAGYSLFCPENQTLTISKAWYGRIAHDNASCVPTTQGPNHTVPVQPDLSEDCGSSLLESKGSWCKEAGMGGCTITVKDLAPATEEKKCPDSAIRYFYLEYECLGSGSEAVVMLSRGVLVLWLSVLASLLMVSF